MRIADQHCLRSPQGGEGPHAGLCTFMLRAQHSSPAILVMPRPGRGEKCWATLHVSAVSAQCQPGQQPAAGVCLPSRCAARVPSMHLARICMHKSKRLGVSTGLKREEGGGGGRG